MKKKIMALIAILLVIIIIVAVSINILSPKGDLIAIKSEDDLQKIADGYSSSGSEIAAFIISPYLATGFGGVFSNFSSGIDVDINQSTSSSGGYTIPPATSSGIDSSSSGWGDLTESASDFLQKGASVSSDQSTTSDYSTTNVQVENVDEADIVKTDGEYIYSLSNDTVYITYARDAKNMTVVSKIQEAGSNVYPEDLIIQNNKLIVISGDYKATFVKVFDLADKVNPKRIKAFKINKKYYTSRYINGILYVISSGYLDDEKNLQYVEDGQNVNPENPEAYKIKDINSKYQTVIASYNLNEVDSKIKVQSYLMDVENAYISEHNMYLIDNGYSGESNPTLGDLYGIKGVFGLRDIEYESRSTNSTIYKFNFKEDGTVGYQTKNTVEGRTIDQFSLDEKDGNLRIALYTNDGSRVVVLDENLKQLGETMNLAEGERMYSARFMGDRAYLVTYKTIDPLFSIDLSDPRNPKVLGELKIPGYSTYLQPYDENHLIGFGFQTEEKVRRNSYGRVVSTSSSITGMKMALFDVSDISNPKVLSEEVIGDSRTNSTILENHKALLFDKEKNLLAIPIKNYTDDLSMVENDDISGLETSYKNKLRNRSYNKIGYAVYNIDLTNGFKFKGLITHDAIDEKNDTSYSYYTYSKSYTSDIRGLYIDNTLYTVSEEEIKANDLETLEEIKEVMFN